MVRCRSRSIDSFTRKAKGEDRTPVRDSVRRPVEVTSHQSPVTSGTVVAWVSKQLVLSGKSN